MIKIILAVVILTGFLIFIGKKLFSSDAKEIKRYVEVGVIICVGAIASASILLLFVQLL